MAENIDAENKIVSETTMDITDKKCPNCAATVEYDPGTLSMTCPFCGYSRKLPSPEETKDIEELDFESAKLRQSLDWGTSKKSIVCKMCGGEAVYDEAMTAGSCPFCGSTSVMPVDQDENIMAPGGVVPFEITNQKAEELFTKWLKGKLFAPNAAKQSCKAENFCGLYLPYWTYDTQTTSSYNAKLGYERKDKEGKVVSVDWRTVRGIYDEFIDDEVVYASKKTNNPYINAVSTFDFAKLRNYSPEFIAGFAAERYTVGLDEGWETAKKSISQKLRANLTKQIRQRYRPDRIGSLNMSTAFDKVTFKYILAPIWIANFKYNNQVFSFAINGQTGKISGKSPVSAIKVIIAILIVAAVLGLFYYLMHR
ncbi:MAG: hypothetical protein J5715_07620 [Clostridiales bacterium]|nr:hypothetical protein [Clostridiales bacterium]